MITAIAIAALASGTAANPALAVLTKVNDYRQTLGLPPMQLNSLLTKAAASHARYMTSNNVFTHQQERGRRDFLAETPTARAGQSGYKGKTVLEDLAKGDLNPIMGILVEGPYHRRPFLQANAKDLGVAVDGPHTVIVVEQERSSDPLVFPAPGMSIAGRWNGFDNPSPLRMHGSPKGPFGPAVQVYVQHVYDLNVERFDLKGRNGQLIDCYLSSRLNDPFLPDGAMLIPKSPLTPGVQYQAQFEGSDGSGRRYSKAWVFTAN